ncbi:MAG: C10 family peptidase [Bacteroidales bacterium]|nr:C10 family peptidase [Bacteroidales bacterium]
MNRSIIFIISLILGIATLQAQHVNNTKAKEIAAGFLNNQQAVKTAVTISDLTADQYLVDGRTIAYIIQNSGDGFVIVSGDKRQKPVIGFSLKNNIDILNLPPAMQTWLDGYSDISLINRPEHPEWQKISLGSLKTKDKSFPEAPVMLSSVWGQSWPYNAHCPEHPNGSNGHTLVGCVATAMAQLMYYWQYPATGVGSESYFWGVDSTVHFDQANYDWALMDDYINSVNRDEIAEISFHAGVSVKMNFGPAASGSSIDKAASALKDHFQYLPTLKFLFRDDYSYEVWKSIMQNEMLAGRPVIYAGYDNNAGGHAFILDGFRDSAYFHINWGWNGGANGYFHLDNMASSGGNFDINQRAVVGIMPYGEPYCADHWYTVNDYVFDDGSGYSHYQNNSSCSYLIEHPSAAPLKLQFTRWQLADAGDQVTVYDGKDNTAPVIGSFDGTQNPTMLTSSSNRVFVEFHTDGSGQGLGWKLKYTTTATSVQDEELSNIQITPNPVNDFVMISGLKKVQLDIYSLDGRLMKSEKLEAEKNRINVSSLSSGIYMVVLTSDNGHRNVKKLVVR